MDLAVDPDAAVLLTCDQPFVNGPALTQLIELRLTSGKLIIASAYAGTLGIPPSLIDLYFPICCGSKVITEPKELFSSGDTMSRRSIFLARR
jgi:CTP:molybdopterin cytidylyltransferase MocA